MSPPADMIRPERGGAIPGGRAGQVVACLAAALLVTSAARIAGAAPPAAPPAAARAGPLDTAAAELRAVDAALDQQTGPSERDALRNRAVRAARLAREDLSGRQADLARIDEQAAQLGQPAAGVVEAPDIRARRRELAARHGTLDSEIKRGKLIAIEADQLSLEIEQSDAEAFSAAISARTASPLLPGYWRPVLRELPRDLRRLRGFMAVQADATWHGVRSGRAWIALLGLLAAAALIGPIRIALRRAGQKVMIDHAPASRLRRTGLALWLTTLGTLVPWFAALALVGSFRAGGMVSAPWEPLAGAFERAALIAGLINALGGALLQRRQASWRLLPIGDRTAGALRPWTFAAAAVAVISISLSVLAQAAGIGATGSSAGDIVATLVHIALALGVLVVIGRIRIRIVAETAADPADDQRLAGVALVALVPWAAAIVAAGALMLGYLTLALMLSRMLLWLPVVAATLYLFLLATDDLCTGIIAGKSTIGRTLHDAFGLRRSLIDQVGIALSATLRVILLLLAVGIAFSPFGSNLDGLVQEAISLGRGITIGEVTIAPAAILRAGVVLAAGLFVVRVVQRWLVERYLPATELDAGARNSISTVASYVGLILATLWALAALGIGFQRIALLLSALSVGIGFGLQAITQNFVSGLILLAERPVKVGDLIRIGDQEGDVKRISVRATEIEIADRSTLIVPNSELITKTVRNMTLADPLGRVQIKFSAGLDADVEAVRELVFRLFAEADAILDEPAPKVFIDAIVDQAVLFNCIAFVGSPRQVYATRSEVLFRLLGELRAAGIDIGTAPQPFQIIGPALAPPGSAGPIEED